MAIDIKFVFIATGGNGSRPNSFTVRATRHAKWMTKRLNKGKGKVDSPLKLPALVRFIHFDWENDSILVYEQSFPETAPKTPTPLWTELSAFASTQGTPADDPKAFISKSSRVSIVDVYRAVRKAPRGAVLDVSIYSHGFVDGPVLANTGDEERFKAGMAIRTDTDRDGRVRSDFNGFMGESDFVANANALNEFREGFARGATFRVFGCNAKDIVDGSQYREGRRSRLRSTALQVINAAYAAHLKERTAVGKALRKGKKPPSVRINMQPHFAIEETLTDVTHFTQPQLKVLHYGLDQLFFPDKDTGPLTFDRPFSEVIKFIARRTKIGYIFAAAEALPEVACFGAVPGVGGDYIPDGLMFVPKHTFGTVLQFFQNFMGITLDERNYGRFDAAGVAAINDRALNG